MTKTIPHLVLDWHFDIPSQTLSIDITDDLSYTAINGGRDGFTKTFNGETTELTLLEWNTEKHWISENYSDIVGTFQPDYDRQVPHPSEDRLDHAPMGVGPDGYYLDHMQRRQVVLDGKDQSQIGHGVSKTAYSTPDGGRTIFKRASHRNVLYPEIQDPEWDDVTWVDHSQPCLQQPWAEGVKLSSHEEMMKDGIPIHHVQLCEAGGWPAAPNPELQQLYTYPTQ